MDKMVHESNSVDIEHEGGDNDERAVAAAGGVTTDAEAAAFAAEISMDDCAAHGWTLASRRAQCDVWTMGGSSGGAAGAVRVKIDGSAAFADVALGVLLEVVTSPAHMGKWDESMREFRTVARLDARTRINYYRVAMPLPLRSRDWVLRQSTVAPPRGTPPAARAWAIFNRSCAWPALPPRPDCVRAHCILNGWRLAPTPDGRGCRVHYYAHNEFCGAVPTALVNWALRVFSASVIRKLRQACAIVLQEKQAPTALLPSSPDSKYNDVLVVEGLDDDDVIPGKVNPDDVDDDDDDDSSSDD